jgi:hypothetical protein
MKRTFSTMFVVIVVAASAVSTASARHWDGDDGPVVTQQPTVQQHAPAKHHKKVAKKVSQSPYYHGPH